MCIGMLVDTYERMSGVTHHITLSTRGLEKLGHEVFVFTFGYDKYSNENTKVVYSPALPLGKSGYKLSVRYTHQAKNLLQTMDVLHYKTHHKLISC